MLALLNLTGGETAAAVVAAAAAVPTSVAVTLAVLRTRLDNVERNQTRHREELDNLNQRDHLLTEVHTMVRGIREALDDLKSDRGIDRRREDRHPSPPV